MNRRQWLKTGSAAISATALPFSSFANTLQNAPYATLLNDNPIRLQSNENALGPSPAARKAMLEAFDLGCRYPSQFYGELKKMIAVREGVTPEHIFLGAGSHEVLRVAGMAYGIRDGEILTAYPTYEAMERYATAVGAYTHRIALDEQFMIDLEEMDRRTTQAVKLVFLCNPNNPTGTVLPGPAVDAFCEEVSKRSIVLVDEAYHEFVDDPEYYSMIHRVKAGDNIIVSRTFSKIFGLAGLRIGYGIARPDIIRRLQPFSTGSGVNILAVKAAIASYGDDAFSALSKKTNEDSRKLTTNALQQAGFRVLPSQTNFVFFELGSNVREFQKLMAERGILVGRPFPPYTDWCRVSLGTLDEMKSFISAFSDLKESGHIGSM